MTEWLDRIANNLLRTEHDLRTTLREISRGGRPARLSGYQTIGISTNEARTLLHGAMPAPIAVTKLREPHARLVAALAVFHTQLLKLNDPIVLRHEPETVLRTVSTLQDELREWHRIIRWRTACRRARVKFPIPPRALEDRVPVAINTIMQLDREQIGPAAMPPWQPLPPRRQLNAVQAEFDFGPPHPTAEIIDMRQLQLFKTEAHHGKAA